MRSLSWMVTLALWAGVGCGDDGASAGSDGGSAGVDGGAAPEVPNRILDYLRADRASAMVLEVDAVAGTEPSASVQERFAAGLSAVVDKPAGLTVTVDGTVSSRGTDHAWTDAELRALGDESFDLDAPADTVKMHAVFVDGHYAGDDSSRTVLGITYDHTHLFLFAASIDRACSAASIGPLLRDELCEAATLNVLTHEAGHVIGLVDRGLPMVTDHRDHEHGRHDDSSECVMYWAAETGRIVEVLADRLVGGGDAALPFDEACLADVAAVRDR